MISTKRDQKCQFPILNVAFMQTYIKQLLHLWQLLVINDQSTLVSRHTQWKKVFWFLSPATQTCGSVDVWCWRKTVEILTDALKIVCGFTCMAKFSQYLSPCSPVILRYIVWYLQSDAPLWYCGMTHGSNRCCTLIRIISTSTVSNKPFSASVTTVKRPVHNNVPNYSSALFQTQTAK